MEPSGDVTRDAMLRRDACPRHILPEATTLSLARQAKC
jgi:hypothetical protein